MKWGLIFFAVVFGVVACSAESTPVVIETPEILLTTTTLEEVTVVPTTTTTTTTTIPAQVFDVVVYGDGLGAVGAAVAAARQEVEVVLISEIGYFGGQAGPGGVSTMDEGSIEINGLYAEMIMDLDSIYGDLPYSQCYYGLARGLSTHCPDPLSVHNVLLKWMQDAGVTMVFDQIVTGVIQEGNEVLGLTTESGTNYLGFVLDGSEFSDLYPMIAGLDYEVGNRECVQGPTWATVVNWYSDGRPALLDIPISAYDDLVEVYGQEWGDRLMGRYRTRTLDDGVNWFETGTDWPNLQKGMTFESESGYRGMGDLRAEVISPEAPVVTRTGLNRANDGSLNVAGVEDFDQRVKQLTQAQDQTYLYLWYLQYELVLDHWGLANDLHFEMANRWFNNPTIPDGIEQYFTPIPYIRESRRLTDTVTFLTYEDLLERGVDRHTDSVMVGSYKTDQHGCHSPEEKRSGGGMYDVPIGVFLPASIDGFMSAMVRSAGVDRIVESSVRMQPTELVGGQVAGIIVALSIQMETDPRDLSSDVVRQTLVDSAVLVDVPSS